MIDPLCLAHAIPIIQTMSNSSKDNSCYRGRIDWTGAHRDWRLVKHWQMRRRLLVQVHSQIYIDRERPSNIRMIPWYRARGSLIGVSRRWEECLVGKSSLCSTHHCRICDADHPFIRMATNRIITVAIITVLVLLIIAVIVSKFR